ncbi:hypothetical protein P280DRAFT_472203 [Massarina eburnea CBS 473.64]|uniref:CFEM domain-containing protein n=1 Tax=Massarina eburnea CBS 473.64 TaxID=1395130 RepID=A0A6A6RTE1_9PLEO|nr:hypothetical protein P280DRAFT_472203 [Massarina eburnea CBS 473.64]
MARMNPILALVSFIMLLTSYTAVAQVFSDLTGCQQQCFAETLGTADGGHHCQGNRDCICSVGFESAFRNCAKSRCQNDNFSIVDTFATNFCKPAESSSTVLTAPTATTPTSVTVLATVPVTVTGGPTTLATMYVPL